MSSLGYMLFGERENIFMLLEGGERFCKKSKMIQWRRIYFIFLCLASRQPRQDEVKIIALFCTMFTHNGAMGRKHTLRNREKKRVKISQCSAQMRLFSSHSPTLRVRRKDGKNRPPLQQQLTVSEECEKFLHAHSLDTTTEWKKLPDCCSEWQVYYFIF